MAKLKAPFALDRSLNTTEQTSRNIADVLAEELSAIITALGGLNFINYEVVEELPTTEISTTTIYLVPSDDPQSGNTYDEYINLNGTSAGWEKIGSTAIDLSGYYTSAETDALLDEKVDKDSFDEQTATDEFETINGGLLSECKVALSPNQDLHGYSEPWVGGANKNKLPLTVENLKAWNTAGTWSGNTYTYLGMDFTILTDDANNVIGIDENGATSSYPSFKIFNGTLSGSYKYCRDNARSRVYANGSQVNDGTSDYSFTASGETYEINLFTGAVTLNHQIVKPMLVLSTETDSTFAPYSNICPISGHTQVVVGDDGKNRFDGSFTDYYIIGSDGSPESNGFHKISADFIFVKPNTTYTISGTNLGQRYAGEDTAGVRYAFYDSNKNFLYRSDSVVNPQSVTFTTTADTRYVKFNCGGNATNVQIELGSTATPYVPYNGYQITVNLGGTYYSGVLDVVSGVFPPDTAGVDLGTLTWTYNGTRFASYISDITLENTRLKGICSHYPVFDGSVNDAPDKSLIFNNSNNTIYIKDSAYTDASAFTTAMSGVQVVYKLANPTPIQLIPTPVKANVGENRLSAPLEGQEITEVKYKKMFTFDDVIAYIQSLS